MSSLLPNRGGGGILQSQHLLKLVWHPKNHHILCFVSLFFSFYFNIVGPYFL